MLLNLPPRPNHRAPGLGGQLLHLGPGQTLQMALMVHGFRTDPYSVEL